MREDLFKKYVAAKRMELEYRLMGVYYRGYECNDKKPAYMFAQYVDILNDISRDLTRTFPDYNYITAEQMENLTAALGGLFFEYNIKLQGKSLFDGFNTCLKDITGQELPDDIKELLQEDNEDEK